MRINRVKHEKNYTIIQNSLLNDERLSYAARGLLCHMLSHHDNWIFSGINYFKTDKAGKSKVSNLINELIDNGYVKRVSRRNEKGIFECHEYHIFEDPSSCTVTPPSEKLEVDNPSLDKGDNNNINKNNTKKNNIMYTAENIQRVKITVEQYEKLKNNYGQESVDKKIINLERYIIKNGNKYRNHFGVLNIWLEKDKIKETEEFRDRQIEK